MRRIGITLVAWLAFLLASAVFMVVYTIRGAWEGFLEWKESYFDIKEKLRGYIDDSLQ